MRNAAADRAERAERFSVWLVETRKAAGYSPAELADELGVDRTTIWRWERGHWAPDDYSIITGLARVLGVSVDEVLTAAGLARRGHDRQPRNQRPVHPLMVELSRLLAPDSPMPDEERKSLETVIDQVLIPYRRHLQTGRLRRAVKAS